ncbi:TIGR03619 family F420-dependent LLM class oxidoreductase [Nocardia huaxiensis]|uniref:TIGR03619 family F420-dependent LLM class oxidoreductase n=1 Tax=Nocardia huaxiensis TaxID=2755382 RepID=UPI001E57B87F|nr:TIGR03619 family F420-dependent LLM class oxidoreductase [Nocardia huaxiensis]UFS98528.1 TIGR03619 family F420-dependent LLM class oxidoreductase [Nocardia huaxiensis]
MATLVEEAGFGTVWLADHTVLIEDPASRYPFSADGVFLQPADEDWYDWLVTLSYLAAVTDRVRLGVCVAILPLRHPLVLAKQLATLDRLSRGRVTLGAGVGWLAEEYEALGVPFRQRGALTDAGLELLRAAWTGAPAAGSYGPYEVPKGVRLQPVPRQSRMPILIGGHGPKTFDRIVAHGDGWAGSTPGGRPEPEFIRSVVTELDARCTAVGRDPRELTIQVRVSVPGREAGTPAFTAYLRGLRAAGVTDLSYDMAWRDPDRVRTTLRALANATKEVMG